MKVNPIFLAANPFIDAYIHSDFLGKLIFISLVLLSIITWSLVIHKFWVTRQSRKSSAEFKVSFEEQKNTPLNVEIAAFSKTSSPFLDIYLVLKKHSIDILNKNRHFGAVAEKGASYLTSTDLDIVETHLFTSVALQTKKMEKNLFILSTIVSLAPFLGLLGTVWGILTTFSEMQTQGSAGSHQIVLGGLSLALATTVLGLIDAIPALIGYNYLKNVVRDFHTDMVCFATEILASVERQYRKVDMQ